MLEVDNISVSYGRIPAVRGVSLNVDEGEIVTLVGPNGAGKSTTLMTVAGALTPTNGTVRLNGDVIVGKGPENIARLGVSFVPEGRHVFTHLSVEENLRLGTDMRQDKKKIEEDFERVISYFPFMKKRLSTPGGKLSGGEQQQLVIGRALMTAPKIILVDEPSLGLGPIIVDKVYEILHALREEGNTLLVVEQNTVRALENADRVYVLRSGQIELSGDSKELTDQELERAYFGFEEAPSDEGTRL